MAPLVRKMPMVGKKGDTIQIPAPTRGSASAKAENTAVTLQANTESYVQVVVNKHYEYSRLIEDIVSVQAQDSLRRFYTEDAGYALAKQIDTDLIALGKSLGDGDGSDWTHSAAYYVDASTGLTLYADDTVVTADVVTDAGFRKLIQLMDDADVPGDGRKFMFPPSVRNTLMGIDRYVSRDFVGGNTVNNGLIGNLYGVDLYMTSNSPVVETDAQNSVGGDIKACLLFHTDSFILAEQLKIRSQKQYKQEYLADLYTADTIYGVKVFRPDSAFALMVNA